MNGTLRLNGNILKHVNYCRYMNTGVAGNLEVTHNIALINQDDFEVVMILKETVGIHFGLQLYVHHFSLITTPR